MLLPWAVTALQTELFAAQAVSWNKGQLEQPAALLGEHCCDLACELPVALFAELNTGLASCWIFTQSKLKTSDSYLTFTSVTALQSTHVPIAQQRTVRLWDSTSDGY